MYVRHNLFHSCLGKELQTTLMLFNREKLQSFLCFAALLKCCFLAINPSDHQRLLWVVSRLFSHKLISSVAYFSQSYCTYRTHNCCCQVPFHLFWIALFNCTYSWMHSWTEIIITLVGSLCLITPKFPTCSTGKAWWTFCNDRLSV